MADSADVRMGTRTAATVTDFDPVAQFDAKRLPLLDRVSQFALVAAREAIDDAFHLEQSQAPTPATGRSVHSFGVAPQRSGAVFAAGMGLESIDAAYWKLYGEAANRLHPLTVLRFMPNAPASHLAIEFGLRGATFAVASACASASHAIGLAFHMVRSGQLDLALAGGSEASLSLGSVKAWEALRVLSPDVCRPFSRDRQGLVLGEGAGVLVLEEWAQAEQRGARIHAELVGFGMNIDAVDMIRPDETSAALAMQEALADGGVSAQEIDYVNAHGTGTRLNDVTETAALKRVFGERLSQLPVSSSKSMIGHCLNACGALEAIVTTLALREGLLPPTIGFREPDPDCDLDCVPNMARRAPVRVAMSNSFAFGGMNAVLLFRRPA
jgi:nodulation protein E